MRNSDRIPSFCNELAAYWQTYYPDLRFWQVISLITKYFDSSYFRRDPFYAEEEDWQKAIQKAIEAMKEFEKNS